MDPKRRPSASPIRKRARNPAGTTSIRKNRHAASRVCVAKSSPPRPPKPSSRSTSPTPWACSPARSACAARNSARRSRPSAATARKWVPIAKDLEEDVADNLREIIARHWIQGFEFQNSIKRWYTSEKLATHLTGFTGEIEETKDENGKPGTKVVGRFGVEYSMEDYLAGRDGWREHCRDQRGLVVPGNSSSLMPPRAGLNVQLTIDMGLQAIVEEELDAGLAEFKSELGAVILMDPKTGEILAMASRPHFDLNRRELGEDGNGAGFNFAIQAVYEPGSTFKMIADIRGDQRGSRDALHLGVLSQRPLHRRQTEVPDHTPSAI
jgi:cell division protein FtsI/penicillin-binding protein 2